VIALIVIGVLALAGGATGLTLELTRPATTSEAQAAATAEVASRWQRLPAGQIFPRRLSYLDSADISVHLTRSGIARPAGCAQALDPSVAQEMIRNGCRTMLRASYVDSTGTMVATVGIAVFPGSIAAARAAQATSLGDSAGLDAFSVPGTAASGFGNGQRQTFGGAYPQHGPYIFLASAGFTDARARTAGPGDPALLDLVNAVPGALVTTMTKTGDACREKDIRC
jgi:hypothetical protein